MRSFVADIADFQNRIFRKFPLRAEIVLLNIRRFQIRINKNSADRNADKRRDRTERRRNRRGSRESGRLRNRDERIGECSQKSGQTDTQAEIRKIEKLCVGKSRRNAVVINSVTAANDEFSGFIHAIRKTDARRKIVFIGRNERFFNRRNSRKLSAFRLHQTVRRRRGICSCADDQLIGQKIYQSALFFDRQTVKIVAQAKIER